VSLLRILPSIPVSNPLSATNVAQLDQRRCRADMAGAPRVGEYVLDSLILDAKNERPDDRVIYASIAMDGPESALVSKPWLRPRTAASRPSPLRLIGTLSPSS
jgi:hypothetical protein